MWSLKYAAYAACAAGVILVASKPLKRIIQQSSDPEDKEGSPGLPTQLMYSGQSKGNGGLQNGKSSSQLSKSGEQGWLEKGVLNAVLNVAQWPLDYLEKSVHNGDDVNQNAAVVHPTDPVLPITRLAEAKKNTIPAKSIYYKDIENEAANCLSQQQQARKIKAGDAVGEKKMDKGLWKDPDFGPEDSSLSPGIVAILAEVQSQGSVFVDALCKAANLKPGSSIPWKLPRDLNTVRKQPGHRPDGEGTWLYLDVNEIQNNALVSLPTSKKLQAGSVVSMPIVIGNRYFATAVALVLQSNPLICDSIIDFTYEAQGIYGVTFFVDGKWSMIWVDSYLPCFPPVSGALTERPRPLFPSATDSREIWTTIVEKASAKLYRSYESMQQAPLNTTLEQITGGDANLVDFSTVRGNATKANNVWRQIQKNQHCNRNGGVRSFSGTHIIFMAACSRQEPSLNADVGNGPVTDELQGIAHGHTYAVVAAVEAAGQRLVQLRSPPGVGGWIGDWSPSSKSWESAEGAEMKRAIEAFPPSLEEGDFWMPFMDFMRCFDSITTLRMKVSAEDAKLRTKLLECVFGAGVGRAALTPGLELRYRHLMQQAVADKMAQELLSAESSKRKKVGKTNGKTAKVGKADKGSQRNGTRKGAQ